MKKKYTKTPLVDEYLQSISGMKPAETDPFFYTRLKAKMEKNLIANQPQSNFKWAFAICALAIFLMVNCWILSHPYTQQNEQAAGTTQQSFAETYSIGNSLSY